MKWSSSTFAACCNGAEETNLELRSSWASPARRCGTSCKGVKSHQLRFQVLAQMHRLFGTTPASFRSARPKPDHFPHAKSPRAVELIRGLLFANLSTCFARNAFNE